MDSPQAAITAEAGEEKILAQLHKSKGRSRTALKAALSKFVRA
jgi:hypothetical protein